MKDTAYRGYFRSMSGSKAMLPVIDLFSGGGGFSRGAYQAGIPVAASFDIDPILSSSYRINFPKTKFYLKDVSSLTAEDVFAVAGRRIGGIFGGPPCQGFSDIGRREPTDPRRELIDHFFRLVAETKPAFFVMENVRGLSYAGSKDVLDRAISRVSGHYNLFGPQILDAADFGAATRRSRLFVIGIHKDSGDGVCAKDMEMLKRSPETVQSAIADLEGAIEIQGSNGFDAWQIKRLGRPSEYARRLRSPDRVFTSHQPTVHTENVVRRFESLLPGEVDKVGRHPRLRWDGQCPTLRAGTGADKGSYQAVRPIHPELPRVITVREAARLQGFPDAHLFHPTVWHSFRMIGNSVSPVIAEAILATVRAKLHWDRRVAEAAE